MSALARTVLETFPNQKRTLVVGVLRDKNVKECLASLKGLFERIVVVEPESPRAMPREDLAARIRSVLGTATEIELGEATKDLDRKKLEETDVLIVTGSVYLAGALRLNLMPVEESERRR
jgi:dihydrofolate synthase/folylpolyglutamate synthase